MPRKPKPNRILPRDGEIVEALIGGRWRKAKFVESYAVFTGDSPTGPTGYTIRDHFEFKSAGSWQTDAAHHPRRERFHSAPAAAMAAAQGRTQRGEGRIGHAGQPPPRGLPMGVAGRSNGRTLWPRW
jgi:hypothetical protein